jgi:hypothetical protein
MLADKHLDRGIWQTTYGFRIVLRIHGKLHTKRFPPTYTLTALRSWRDEHLRRHKTTTTRGTFARDVAEYLTAVGAMPTLTDRTREIGAWLPAFGERPRWTLTPETIRRQLHQWKSSGLAASTVNHRRTALSHLYTVLDGKNA